jgi:hypothetical protein
MNAEEIIKLQERLENDDSLLRSRWQDEANYIFPRESNITDISMPGAPDKVTLYDTTAVTESDNMVSGLLTNLVPAGQKFFSFGTDDDEVEEMDVVKSYMARATSRLHEELFTSNYILQLTETLGSLTVHGTGNSYSEWKEGGLNFTDWDIARYQILENFAGAVDTMILKFPKTAKQAYEKWGSKAGKSVVELFEGPGVNIQKQNDTFWFIHMVRPRKNWNPRFEDSMNMSFESQYISIKDKEIVDEGGYPEFPYAVPRWKKTTGEAHGRGVGTMILPQVKMVNANKKDFNNLSNKYPNPPMDVLQSFEGTYKTFPGARNNVMELPTGQPQQLYPSGFPISKDSLEFERQVIKDAFYASAFAPLTGLTGDRRNELEIRQRVMEAFRKIGSPIGRLESELFTPQLTRCYHLLVRNGAIEPPPPELQGRKLKIMYLGPLSLAQQNAEVSASQQWIGTVAEMEATSPAFAGSADNINVDKAVRRMGRIFGVNENDIATEQEVKAKRDQRRQELERQKALEAAQVTAGAYGQTTKAPEKGSAAEKMSGVK